MRVVTGSNPRTRRTTPLTRASEGDPAHHLFGGITPAHGHRTRSAADQRSSPGGPPPAVQKHPQRKEPAMTSDTGLGIHVHVAPMRPVPDPAAQEAVIRPMWSPCSSTLIAGETEALLVDTLI